MRERFEQYLAELTSLPTATGCEDRVVAWVTAWAARRKQVRLQRDQFGNVLLKRHGSRSRSPIVLAAHMDHPAFVVSQPIDGRTIEAVFRGGVQDSFFIDTAVRWHGRDGASETGCVVELKPADEDHLDKRAVIRFDRPADARQDDVITWDLPPASAKGDRFAAPACDDLAGVAAAIAAFETLLRSRSKKQPDVRVLLTRAEEVGFVGAMAACRSGILPAQARIVALETSKSFADSPIGGGPIVRVGDRTSTFDPELTYRASKLAEQLAQRDSLFKWQRKLMPGGTCEATAYQTLGFTATCVCLALGNYHNMNDTTGRIDSEQISLADFHGLVRLLVEVGRSLDEPSRSQPLRQRLDDLFEQRRHLLER